MLFLLFELFQSVCSRFLTLHLVLPSSVIRISVVQFSMTKGAASYSRLFYYSRSIRTCQVFFSTFARKLAVRRKNALSAKGFSRLALAVYHTEESLSRGKYAKSQKFFNKSAYLPSTCIRQWLMIY